MRKFMLAALIAAFVAVTLTTQAAQRGRRQAKAPRSVFVAKNSPAAARALAWNLEMDRQKAERCRGLSVEPHPEAKGDERATQERIADLLSRQDYVPAHRVEHFRWIPEQMGMTIAGWRGRIVETARAPGGVLVKVKITPIAGLGTSDHTLESYLSTNDGRLVHVASEGAPSRGVITFH